MHRGVLCCKFVIRCKQSAYADCHRLRFEFSWLMRTSCSATARAHGIGPLNQGSSWQPSVPRCLLQLVLATSCFGRDFRQKYLFIARHCTHFVNHCRDLCAVRRLFNCFACALQSRLQVSALHPTLLIIWIRMTTLSPAESSPTKLLHTFS